MQGNTLTKKIYGPEIQRLLVAMPIFSETGPSRGHIGPQQEVIGAVTISSPLSGIKATLAQISSFTIYSGLAASLIAGIIAFTLARAISSPLQTMTRSARRLVDGNFQNHVEVKGKGELAELSTTFNQAVTEVKRTVEEQKRLQSLQQNLVANVSHEFRAPLTSIQGFVEAILEDLVKEEEKEKYLHVILDNTAHLNRLVNDLLELSSIRSGKIKLNYEEISPQAIAVKAVNTLLPKAQEKKINLEVDYEKDLPYVRGDEDRLYQVLINLLENAITFSYPGRTVKLYVEKQNKEVVFSVNDKGIGISTKDQPYIWDQFYKADKSRNREDKGKGLGLAIVREIVHLHHGRVEVKSIPEKGSTFYVYLPAII